MAHNINNRNPVEAHMGVQSVATDFGKKPKQHSVAKSKANAKLNAAMKGPKMRPNFIAIPGR